MTDYLKPIFNVGSGLVGMAEDATDADVKRAQDEAESFIKTILNGAIEFFESLIAIFILVMIWAWICVSMLSFTRPDSKGPDSKVDDNDPSKSFTNTIIGELDQLFPDDIEYAPYGFDWSRGIPQKQKVEAEEVAEQKKQSDGNEDDDDANSTSKDESKLSKFLKYAKGDKTSSVPYKWSAREFEAGSKFGKYDTAPDGSFIKNEKRYKETFMDSITEWFTNSIYFGYGNSRAIIKKIFRWLNVTMINETPSACDGKEKEPDPKSDYAYTSNAMVLLYILLFLLVFIPFFGLGIGSTFMILVGSIWNQTAKKDKAGSDKYTTETFGGKIFEGLIYTLVFGAVTIMPAAGASYFILPAVFLCKLLLYPLSTKTNRENCIKLLAEISPMLVFLFSVGMAISANYSFPQPFSYIIIGAVFVAYAFLFKDHIKRLFGFIALIKGGLIKKKNYDPKKAVAAVEVQPKPAQATV
jgi:hypothetical protein